MRPISLGGFFGSAAVACSVLAASPLARAQVVGTDAIGQPRRPFESPQHFALEARFGAFSPAVDSDPVLSGAKPFTGTFGSSPQLMSGVELEWEALRIPHFGTVGPGLGIGYMKASDKAKIASTGALSGEDTALEIIPMYADASLRVDVLWRDLRLPLVPWVKVGLADALWRASNTLGTSTYNSMAGEGHTLGTHFALGLGFNLNAVDPDTAREFDESMGVNGTYLFAEWTYEDLTGLGSQSHPMRVGGTEWTFGLALEF